jgi:hypothetical protein
MKQKIYGTLVAIFIFILFTIFANIAKVISIEKGLPANLIYMLILVIGVIIIRFSWKKITQKVKYNNHNLNIAYKTSDELNNSNLDEIYEQIMIEIEDDNKVKSTWARAFAQCDGNKEKSEAMYIKLRMIAIKKEKASLDYEIEDEDVIKEKTNNKYNLTSYYIKLLIGTIILIVLFYFYSISSNKEEISETVSNIFGNIFAFLFFLFILAIIFIYLDRRFLLTKSSKLEFMNEIANLDKDDGNLKNINKDNYNPLTEVEKEILIEHNCNEKSINVEISNSEIKIYQGRNGTFIFNRIDETISSIPSISISDSFDKSYFTNIKQSRYKEK